MTTPKKPKAHVIDGCPCKHRHGREGECLHAREEPPGRIYRCDELVEPGTTRCKAHQHETHFGMLQ